MRTVNHKTIIVTLASQMTMRIGLSKVKSRMKILMKIIKRRRMPRMNLYSRASWGGPRGQQSKAPNITLVRNAMSVFQHETNADNM